MTNKLLKINNLLDEAFTTANKALAIYPNQELLLNCKYDVCYKQNKLQEALVLVERIIEITDDVQFWQNRRIMIVDQMKSPLGRFKDWFGVKQ